MHPALIILFVVFSVHTVGLIGRERIEAGLRPLYVRLLYSSEAKQQRQLKRDLFAVRQQLNLTSSQDEFAKWAKLRRNVDKIVTQLEANNARLAGASSSLSLLVRAVLFLATTLFPFCLTFYYGKTPMFFLPPSDASPHAAAASYAKAGLPVRRAPGGFEIPYDASHAWGMLNETYFGPLGWLLCMTAAPRGSVSAGMWSTVCTRVAILVTNHIKDILCSFMKTASKEEAAAKPRADANPSEKASPSPATASSSDGARKRTTAKTVTSSD